MTDIAQTYDGLNGVTRVPRIPRKVVGPAKPQGESGASRRPTTASRGTGEKALQLLGASLYGLSEEVVVRRRQIYGINEVAHEKPPGWYKQLFEAFLTPFNGILFFVGSISFLTDVVFTAPEDTSYEMMFTLALMILLSTGIRFWQEYRSGRAAEKLKMMIRTTAAVLRADDEAPHEIHIEELVPGDIVHLAAGGMVPADLRLLTSKDLFISQAMLTGESLPVEKHDILRTDIRTDEVLSSNVLELGNICFMGTNVASGAAKAVVVASKWRC